MKNKNIIAVRNLLRSIRPCCLREVDVVENLVRAFGIVQWGPPVFGYDELFKNPTTDMAGCYQTPRQIAEALVYLSQFKIERYGEIGVFQGGNFLFTSEYLRRFNPTISCVAVDPTNFLNDEIAQIIEEEPYLTFIPATSEALIGEPLDLVMIDGDHSAAWVRRDWRDVGQHAAICLIHDIQETTCPAVRRFWRELKKRYPQRKTMEFLTHTSEKPAQGIGIIHNVRSVRTARHGTINARSKARRGDL